MITFTVKGVLKIAEAWFDESADGCSADIVRYFQRASPEPGAICSEFHTIVIDLARQPDELLAAMSKETRYEIRRAAEKDSLAYRVWDRSDDEWIDDFCRAYDEFALTKGLDPISRASLLRLHAAGLLDLSIVETPSGEPRTWHAHYVGQNRARLLYSVSHYRNHDDKQFRALAGRANRYHHWADIQRFRDAGLACFDFGGWYHLKDDPAKLRINEFKEGFGGSVQKMYNGTSLRTWKGAAGQRLLDSVRHNQRLAALYRKLR